MYLKILLIIGAILIALLSGTIVANVTQQSSFNSNQDFDDQLIPEQTPLLSVVNIPQEGIVYPEYWPTDLNLSEQFTLVEATSGALPQQDKPILVAAFRFKGEPQQAVEILEVELKNQGWQIEKMGFGTSSLIQFEKSQEARVGSFSIAADKIDVGGTKISLMTAL